MSNNDFTFKVCISTKANEKKPTESEYKRSFHKETTLTIGKFAELIGKGHSFTNVEGGRKGNKNCNVGDGFSSNYILIDMDGSDDNPLNEGHKISVRTAFGKRGILPTIEYDTFGSSDNRKKFRFVWILRDGLSKEKLSDFSIKLNSVARDACGIKADPCNQSAVRLINGTDKKVDVHEDRLYSQEDISNALADVTANNRKKVKPSNGGKTDKEGICLDRRLIEELEENGVDAFINSHVGATELSNNKGIFQRDTSGDYEAFGRDYEEITIPCKIVNGKMSRKRLKDGDGRRGWIVGWAGTLTGWFLNNPRPFGSEPQETIIYTVCCLIKDNMEHEDIPNEEIARCVSDGCRYPYNGGRKRTIRYNAEKVIINHNLNDMEQFVEYVRKNAAKDASKARMEEIMSMYDCNETIEENAERIGVSKSTLRRYILSEGDEHKTKSKQTREAIEAYIKEHPTLGATTVYLNMRREMISHCPKSRTTVYNVFKELGIERNGKGETNKTIENTNATLADHIKETERVQSNTNKRVKKVEETTEMIERRQSRQERINESVRREMDELKAENEALKIDNEEKSRIIDELSTTVATMGEKQYAFEEDMANLNAIVVDAVDKQNEMAEDIDGIKEKIGGL